MCIHGRGKQFTQAGSDSLHVVMCMHAGGKPQFTCGHVRTGGKPQFTCGHVRVEACTGRRPAGGRR